MNRAGRWLALLAGQLVLAAALLGAAELALRAATERPGGLFEFALTSPDGLYPPGGRKLMRWGRIDYVVETNSLGLRGREASRRKPEGITRIAAVGDSVTDGFSVDNPDTFPWLLQDLLVERGHAAEVLNVARGGATIDKEFALVRDVAAPLDPDVLLLTFVTNDIKDLRGKTREDLVTAEIPRSGALDWLRAKTAVGEWVSDTVLAMTDRGYRKARDLRSRVPVLDASRYQIAGAREIARNRRLFEEKFEDADMIVERYPWTPEVEKLVGDYLYALGQLSDFCREAGMELVLVYFPSYVDVYDRDAPARMRRTLADASSALDIRYLDLTEPFRRAARTEVLHLAPVDFHPNPAGNRVMASAIADFLEGSGVLRGRISPAPAPTRAPGDAPPRTAGG